MAQAIEKARQRFMAKCYDSYIEKFAKDHGDVPLLEDMIEVTQAEYVSAYVNERKPTGKSKYSESHYIAATYTIGPKSEPEDLFKSIDKVIGSKTYPPKHWEYSLELTEPGRRPHAHILLEYDTKHILTVKKKTLNNLKEYLCNTAPDTVYKIDMKPRISQTQKYIRREVAKKTSEEGLEQTEREKKYFSYFYNKTVYQRCPQEQMSENLVETPLSESGSAKE